MSSFLIHLAGSWRPGQVRARWTESSLALPDDARRLVDAAWAEAAARPGVKLFDGPMCRLESCTATGDSLELAVSRTSYKLFLGTNMANPQLGDRHGPGALANPVGVSALLETADGFLVLGRRNAAVAYYPDRVHPFAGSLEPGDDAAHGAAGPDPFAAVYRELAEELAMSPQDVAEVRCVGLVEDLRLRQPELIFLVRGRMDRATVESRLDAAEHRGSVAVAATAVAVDELMADSRLTPVAAASLLLWGRASFGEAWFTERQPRAVEPG